MTTRKRAKRMKPWTGWVVVDTDGTSSRVCPTRNTARILHCDGLRIARVLVTESPTRKGRK